MSDNVTKMPIKKHSKLLAMTSSLVNLTSDLMSRAGLAMQAGFQFGGKRDLYAVYGYTSKPTFDVIFKRSQRQDLAQRIVNAYPSATWRSGCEVDGGPAFNEAWKTLVEQQNLWAMLKRVDVLSNIGHYAVLVLGLPDGQLNTPAKVVQTAQPVKPAPNTPQNGVIMQPDPPVTALNSVDPTQLLFLQPFSEGSTSIKTLVEDPADKRFGLVKTYSVIRRNRAMIDDVSAVGPVGVNPTQQSTPMTGQITSMEIDASRVIHIAEGLLENNVIGTPRLLSVFNLLDDLQKIVGGSAEMFWLSSNQGMQVNVDKEMELDADDAEALADEISEFQHQLRRFVRTKGVEIKDLGGKHTDPKENFNMLMKLIAAATGIPLRILIGNEAGQLSSEQDRAMWADRVEERRDLFAWPCILKPLIEKCIEFGILPQPTQALVAKWPPAFTMSPLEQGQESAQLGRTVANVMKQGTPGNQIITSKEEARELAGLPRKMPEGDTPFEQQQPPAPTGGNPDGPGGAKGGANADATSGAANNNDTGNSVPAKALSAAEVEEAVRNVLDERRERTE